MSLPPTTLQFRVHEQVLPINSTLVSIKKVHLASFRPVSERSSLEKLGPTTESAALDIPTTVKCATFKNTFWGTFKLTF